ncbi:MAG: type 4a pilus biogenesis protein PilO [Sedimentisphaerales bacterium]|nr:type 4a pilus biogenesis protein PilO [Sedimentisphaerales bacterium]
MLSKRLIKPVSSQKNVIFASLVIIGAIGVYNWIIAPHRNYLQAAQKYESAASNLVKKKQIIINNLKVRKKELVGLEEELNSGYEKLFDSVEAKKFFSDIQLVSEEAGCIMSSLTFSQADSESGAASPNQIIAKTTELTVLGSYGSITTLMNKLQEGSKCVRIETVCIFSDDDNPSYLKCRMSVTIYMIQRKENRRHEV